MMSIAFDTLQMAERLEKAGVPADQAKAHTAILADIFKEEENKAIDRFANASEMKQQFTEIVSTLKNIEGKIDQTQKTVEAKIDTSSAEVKADLMRWVVSVGIIQIAFIAGLVLKFIPAN